MKLTESSLRNIIRQELKEVAKNNSLGEAMFNDPLRAAERANTQRNAQYDQEERERFANNALDLLLDLKAELIKAAKIVTVASIGGGAASLSMAAWLSKNPEFVDQIQQLISQGLKE